jgi:hypothetical protein
MQPMLFGLLTCKGQICIRRLYCYADGHFYFLRQVRYVYFWRRFIKIPGLFSISYVDKAEPI